MKSAAFLFLGLAALSLASELPPSATPPKGVSSSCWSGIRAAYQAGRHAIHRETDGSLTARNPASNGARNSTASASPSPRITTNGLGAWNDSNTPPCMHCGRD